MAASSVSPGGPLPLCPLAAALQRAQGQLADQPILEAAINSTPNLIWYKTKDGIHEKVNDSFCETVNKTKEQVQGQGHAYIWDVEHDDPACIESERLVMESRETRISEETILTGEGQRLLTTYKSPLYDLDGSVMGTVGIAIDITQERLYEQELIQKSRTLRPSSPPLTAALWPIPGRHPDHQRKPGGPADFGLRLPGGAAAGGL